MRKFRFPFSAIPLPGWLFTVFQVVFCETLLHLWITDEVSLPRFFTILTFALGFGLLLSQISAFLGRRKWGKWIIVILCTLVTAFYMVEYFVNYAYQGFMPMETLLNGAKGVATDFADVVVALVLQEFWRILVVLLPIALFAAFAKPMPTKWRTRWFTLAGSLLCYVLAFSLVMGLGTDAARLSNAYNFDSAVRVFGLSLSMPLDMVKGGETATEEEFIITAPPVVQTPVVQTPSEEDVPAETEPVVYGPNVIESLDFAALAESEMNGRVGKIHQYVASQVPSTQNEYTGLFEGKNLIIIAAEAFAKEVIDPELTPTLYRLANEGIRFDDYYQPMWGGSTSSGEWSILAGLVAGRGTATVQEAREQDLFLTMGKQLQKLGYHSAAYHNHLYTFYERHMTHTHFGYDTFMGMGNGMQAGVKEQWPESDLEMFQFTVDQYIDKQPFSIYYMTVSGHCRYNFSGNKMSMRHQEAVAHLDSSDTIKAYIACNLELEYALQHLVEQLEEAGIADDTVIVLSTDHYPYGLEWDNTGDYMTELYGYKYRNIVERDHSALIIWSGCIEDMDLVVDTPVYSLDILPTLSNLFGVEYDSRLLVGRDVFSEAEPLVLWYDHTWRTEYGTYVAATNTFTPAEGVEVDQSYVDRISAIVSNKIYYSREVQSTNYFNYVAKALPVAEEPEAETEPAEETVPETTAETTP